MSELKSLVKLALRIKTEEFDGEVLMLIKDCISEMVSLGINVYDVGLSDAQIQSAIVAYCKWKFGDAENKDDFKHIYHEKVAQFQAMYSTGYAGG